MQEVRGSPGEWSFESFSEPHFLHYGNESTAEKLAPPGRLPVNFPKPGDTGPCAFWFPEEPLLLALGVKEFQQVFIQALKGAFYIFLCH